MKIFGDKKEGVEYKKRPGCYGVIIENNRIGVLRAENYDTYFLTGGGIEVDEDEQDTLRREALEEIGYEIEIGGKIGEAQEYFYSESQKRHILKECRFFRVNLLRSAKKDSKYKLIWIGRDELKNLHHECYRWIVERELSR